MEVTRATAALVTGAGGGIGRAITLRLAELGANLTVVDTSEAGGTETVRLIREMRKPEAARAIFVKCDVACSRQLAQAFTVHMDTFKRLDVCINNAGIAGELHFLPQLKAAEHSKGGPSLMPAEGRPWSRMIDINLKAVADGVRLAVECMEASTDLSSEAGKSKRVIVNVASAAGVIPFPGSPVYSATKAGVVMLTRSLAHLQKDRGIRVCAFCPMFIDTALTRSGGPELEKAVISLGGFIPMKTVVEGIMKLIMDDGNGGSVMQLRPRKGAFYTAFGEHAVPDLQAHHSEIAPARPKPRGTMRPASGVSSQQAMMAQTFPAQFRKVVVTQLSADFRKATSVVSVPFPPAVGQGKVLVRNVFAGVNASDINFSAGRYDSVPMQLPSDCGFESVGRIVGIGKGVPPRSGISIGSAVANFRRGGFSEYQLVHAQQVIPVPEASPAMVAMLTSGLTASIGLERAGQMGRAQTVLVTAAAGGTGQFAVQLAKLAGNTVIGTCGGEEKAALLRSLGVDRVIDYKKENVQEVLKAEFPKGVDLIYESVGGKMFEVALKSLAVKGRLIVIGMISQYATGDQKNMKLSELKGLPERLLFKSQSLVGFFLPYYDSYFRSHIAKLHQLYSKGLLKVAIDPTQFNGVERVADAIEYLHSGKSIGKVVVGFASSESSAPSLRSSL
ncbi:hypothetical protein CBR_g38143 [Chara braunii]|uniref:Enoyl reductase (ER) domain-containing protein n=1 Tax=Chara braunii TaxID=69332 RepID=A0A388LPI3_CHABU|nr:hypothetical protein CBR_g38143 [Chara braunii]|eukprot:GBG84169.1 hypothetical protein CBR_g38143 [Chara braunii]